MNAETDEPMSTTVSIVQMPDGSWCVHLAYADGEVYLSRVSYASEEEAEQAARRWALQNYVPETTQ